MCATRTLLSHGPRPSRGQLVTWRKQDTRGFTATPHSSDLALISQDIYIQFALYNGVTEIQVVEGAKKKRSKIDGG